MAQSQTSFTEPLIASVHTENDDNEDGLAGALKTEDDFLAYVQSLRTDDQEEQRIKQRRPRPPPLPPTPQVGLDHLDNLCRLMEQLSTLREQNSRLQRRVHYLEDLHAVRAVLGIQRPQSEDSIIEASSEPSVERVRSKSQDLSTCSPKSEPKSTHQQQQQQQQQPEWDSSSEDFHVSDPSIAGIQARDSLCIRREDGPRRRQSSPLPPTHGWTQDEDEEGRQGRSLDRGLRLQTPPEGDTSKKRHSAWGRVKTIIQTRRDSLRRRRRRANPAPSDGNNENDPTTSDDGKKNKGQRGGGGDSTTPGHETDTGSKWIKVKRAFLTRRVQPSNLQRSLSVPSNPLDEDPIDLATVDDFPDEMDLERPLSEDVQRHLVEIQRNLSQEFNRKLVEWERMRRTGSTKHGRKRDKDLQWLDKELTKLARDKERLMRERRKFEEREARLQRLRRSLRVPRDDEDQVLVKTAAGEFRFPGISGSFTRRLLEWEEKLGLGPDVSTLALLDSNAPPATNTSGAKLERNRSRSDSSIAETNANIRSEDNATRATSEPELPRMPTPAESTRSYGSLLDENLLLLEQLRTKEETCCQLQSQLEQLDVRLHDMIGTHSKELEKYRQQLETNQGSADPKLLADIQSHLRELHSAEQRLANNREELEVSYSQHSEQQKALAQELVDKMAELHSRSATDKEFPKSTPVLSLPEVDMSKIQALSTDLLQQAQQLEEALSERNTMLRHLRWELMEREASALQPQPMQQRRQVRRKQWTSLEGISSPFSRKQDNETLDKVPEVGLMSEALQAKVKALHEGLVKLWTSTEQSPSTSQCDNTNQDVCPNEVIVREISDDLLQNNPEEISVLDSGERETTPSSEPSTVKARRMSDTTIQYAASCDPFLNATSSIISESGSLSRKRNSKIDTNEDRRTSTSSDAGFIIPGGKLDFAAAFSTTIYDEDALQPLNIPEPPVTAAATVTTTIAELQPPPSPSPVPPATKSDDQKTMKTPHSMATPKRTRRTIVNKETTTNVNKLRVTQSTPKETFENSTVPLASSDTDTDESPGITFTVRLPNFHLQNKQKNNEQQKVLPQINCKNESNSESSKQDKLQSQKDNQQKQIHQEQQQFQEQQFQKKPDLPKEKEKQQQKDEETQIPPPSVSTTVQTELSSSSAKPTLCPFSPVMSRRTTLDTMAPNVRLMIAKFNQRITPTQTEGVLKSSSFATTERPRPLATDVTKSASASDCRPSTPCRLPTRVPQSPRMGGNGSGNSTPRTTRTCINSETPNSVPVSPRLKTAGRVPTEGLPSSVPSSPASRIPRPMMDSSPQSPNARARALKLRHAKDEFLAREPSSPSSPEGNRRVATVNPVVHQNYDYHQDNNLIDRLENRTRPHHHNQPPQQQQASIEQRQQQQQKTGNSSGVVAAVKDMIINEIEESTDGSHAQKSGFFSFRFRKSKCKKKEGPPSTVEMLCRQSLLVEIPTHTDMVAGEASPQSCPSSPEVPPRCTRSKTSWLVKPKLFKQK